jgi:molecular chaperone HscB
MNYFELFQLPVSFRVDHAVLRRKYLQLSKQNHPDYFVNDSSDVQEDALQASALLNGALKTFSSPDETVRYVLQLKGLLQDEEKYTLPPAFLMEMLEINEEMADLALEDEPQKKLKLGSELSRLEKEIYEPVQTIIENYQDGVTTEEELLQVKDYYFKKKYLSRLREQFGGKL